MMKINWFDCDLKVYDSVGMEIDIEELPVKIRREIANAIVNGRKCGSFSGEVVDHELMGELHPIFRTQLEAVAEMQKTANWIRDTEAAQRAKEAELLKEKSNGQIQSESEDVCQGV